MRRLLAAAPFLLATAMLHGQAAARPAYLEWHIPQPSLVLVREGMPQEDLRLRMSRARATRAVPGATVEVVDQLEEVRKEQFLAFQAYLAPLAFDAFRLGEGSDIAAQMLAEFMTMRAENLRPPSLPSVFYNAQVPYWVQQGWKGPYGSGSLVGGWLSMGSSPVLDVDRPLIPYPGRR